MNGENCTKLYLSPILFLYNIYGEFCKANSQSLLAILQTCLTSAASGKCVAVYLCRDHADYIKEQVYFLGNAAETEIFCPRGNQPWCMKCAEDTGSSAY